MVGLHKVTVNKHEPQATGGPSDKSGGTRSASQRGERNKLETGAIGGQPAAAGEAVRASGGDANRLVVAAAEHRARGRRPGAARPAEGSSGLGSAVGQAYSIRVPSESSDWASDWPRKIPLEVIAWNLSRTV